MNPRIPSSVPAHTTATSAIEPLVIHILVPESTQSAPFLVALVVMLDGSLPWSGSVRPKQPIAWPAAILGSHSFFCASDPYLQIGNMAREPCTDTRLRRPESAASISLQVTPYAMGPMPAHPYPLRCMPSRPSWPSSGTSSLGSVPASNQSAM